MVVHNLALLVAAIDASLAMTMLLRKRPASEPEMSGAPQGAATAPATVPP
jgi:hypothetical protein